MSGNIGGFGDSDEKKKPNENIVEFYLRLREGEIEPSTKQNYTSAWVRLHDYIESEQLDKSIFDLTVTDIREWYEYLDDEGLSTATQEIYARSMARMMDDLRSENHITGTRTPFAAAKDVHTFEEVDREFIDIPYNDMVGAINDIDDPRELCEIVLLAKTGIRLAELINLDERDINLNHPISDILDDPRNNIENNPNVLYIDSSIREAKKHNSVGRRYGNKKKSSRKIPLDEELVQTLVWYITMRPSPQSPANPIFVSIDAGSGRSSNINPDMYENRVFTGIGTRVSKHNVKDDIKRFAKNNGYYKPEPRRGVYPHFFRHWFSTQLRKRTSPSEVPIGSVKGFVKGLRGDTQGDVIDTYTHDWEEAFENDPVSYAEVVRKNMPKFFDRSRIHRADEIHPWR